MESRKVVLAGGAGFLGGILADWFGRRGLEVVILSRRAAAETASVRIAQWDGETLGPWRSEIEGAAVLINLAGRSVNCRYHPANRLGPYYIALRIDEGSRPGHRQLHRPPRVWLNSSTATIYKHSFDRPMDEWSGVIAGSAEAKDVFSVEVAQAWERAFDEAVTPETRKVALRTAMVFGVRPAGIYRTLHGWFALG